jgi:hypothetical protein
MTPDIGQQAKGRTISSFLVQTRFGIKDEARAEKTGNCRDGSLGRRVATDAGLVTILLRCERLMWEKRRSGDERYSTPHSGGARTVALNMIM